MALNTKGYQKLWEAIKSVPQGLGDIAKNAAGGAGSVGRATAVEAGGVVGIGNSVLNGAASISAGLIKGALSVASHPIAAPFIALGTLAAGFFGADHFMQKRAVRALAEQQLENAALEQQLAQQQQNAAEPYHPAQDSGTKWGAFAEQRAAATATDRLAQQPVSTNVHGA